MPKPVPRLLACLLVCFATKLAAPQAAVPAHPDFIAPNFAVELPSHPAPIPPSLPVSPHWGGLQSLERAAGIIFSGRVTSVGRAAPSTSAAAVTITFQVEHALRGCTVGQSLNIREWAGLWAKGERYRTGERVLLFLYPPSRLGLTSPVGGDLGRFEIEPDGILLKPIHIDALADDPILRTMLSQHTAVPYAVFERAVRQAIRAE